MYIQGTLNVPSDVYSWDTLQHTVSRCRVTQMFGYYLPIDGVLTQASSRDANKQFKYESWVMLSV